MKYNKNSHTRQVSQQPLRDERRSQNAKRHRRRHKKNYMLYYILLSFLLTVALIVMSFTVFFNIQHFQISENSVFTQEELLEICGLKEGDNLLLLNTNKMEEKIMKQTIFLDRVEVRRKFPSTLEINMHTAEVTHGANYGRLYYFFSESGRLIEISKTNTHTDVTTFWGVDLNKIKLGEYLKITETNEYETALMLIEKLNELEFENIIGADLRDLSNIKLYYGESFEIKLGNISDLDYKLKVSKELIETKLNEGEVGILDVQISGKAYFRATEEVKLPS